MDHIILGSILVPPIYACQFAILLLNGMSLLPHVGCVPNSARTLAYLSWLALVVGLPDASMCMTTVTFP